MKKFLSISKFSNLFSINPSVLRYYDKVGLFKPKLIDSYNQYRYYTIDQCEYLSIILYLRKLGFSIKEIKQELENSNTKTYYKLFSEQKNIIGTQIEELQEIYKNLDNRIKHIENTFDRSILNKVREEYIEDRYVIIMENRNTTIEEFELLFYDLSKSFDVETTLFCGQVGYCVSKEKLINRDIRKGEFDSIFILIDKDNLKKRSQLILLPEGIHICIRYNGTHDDSPYYYKILLDYIEDNSYEILDDSIEIQLIDEEVTNNPNELLNEIQILVRKKESYLK